MTRDFAKKPRPVPKNKPRNKATANHQSHAPAWIWLVTGAGLGALIMFLAYLSGVAPQQSGDLARPAQPQASKAGPQTPKPRFDFYTLLKESEIEVRPPTSQAKPPGANQADEEFILQVGSFKKLTDADRLRAELILLNLDAQVETVTVRNGQTWHRVLVGPYYSSSNVAKARSVLASNDINPLLLKRKRH